MRPAHPNPNPSSNYPNLDSSEELDERCAPCSPTLPLVLTTLTWAARTWTSGAPRARDPCFSALGVAHRWLCITCGYAIS